MQVSNIFDSWGSIVKLTLDEFRSQGSAYWRQLLIDRKFLVLKGFGPELTDAEYHETGTNFGRIWDKEDYRKTPTDKTVKNIDTTPVSYFQTNNMWGARDMKYHADQAHMDEQSFPGRSLYMVKTANNNSGATSWLNLELAWEQFTQEEQRYFDDIEIVQQYMYEPGTRLEKFPFLKISPYSNKPSPRINCYITPGKNSTAWVHHVEKNGRALPNSGQFIETVYRQCEAKKDVYYTHHWENGDMLVYDNWFSVHRRESVKLEENEKDRLLKRLTFNI